MTHNCDCGHSVNNVCLENTRELVVTGSYTIRHLVRYSGVYKSSLYGHSMVNVFVSFTVKALS